MLSTIEMAQLHNTTLRSFDSQYSRTTHPDNLVKPLRPRDDRSASGHTETLKKARAYHSHLGPVKATSPRH